METDNNLQDWRLTKVESDIKEIKDLVIRMDKKLAGIPDSGLQCSIHMLKMEANEKRLDVVEAKTDNMHKKIITWSAVAAVILFLISQVAVPYALNNYKITTSHHPTISLTTTNR